MENPYLPPAAEPPSLSTGLPSPLLKVRGLALASLWLYGASLVAEIADYVGRFFIGPPVNPSLHDSYYAIGPIYGFMMITSLAGCVVYLVWKYRAAWNARILDPSVMRHSPAMAVGSYFIPLANLVIPCQVMAGIARASTGSISLVGWWWAGHAGGLLVAIASVIFEGAETSLQPTGFDHLFIAWSIPTFLVSRSLVMRITRAQVSKGAA